MLQVYLSKLNIFKIFLLVLTVKILNGLFFSILNDYYFKLNTDFDRLEKRDDYLIWLLIIGPIIETLIFQLSLNKLLVKLKIENNYLLLFVPSVLFGLAHHYHWLYVVCTMIGGLMLNWFYLYAKEHGRYAFWLTALLHSLYNLIGYYL
jgi:uncharacterized protein